MASQPHVGAAQGPGERAPQPTHVTVSAVIISCDEAAVIEPCLRSVASWVDEIVVVDMHSTDGTREIAQRYTDRLFDHERLAYADPARNFALGQATCDWIIMLDPDERVPEALAQELRRLAEANVADVVVMPFQYVVFGTAMHSAGASDTSHPRFFRRGTISWPPEVHGSPDLSALSTYEIPKSRSDLAVRHETMRTFAQALDKIMRYAPKDMENYQAAGLHFSTNRMLYRALNQLTGRFFEGRAYEDGMAGFFHTMFWVFYDVAVFAELWEAEGRPSYADRQIRRWGRRLRLPGRIVHWLISLLRKSGRIGA